MCGAEEGHLPQDMGAERGMRLDDLELVLREGAVFLQHAIGDADLADVVQQRAKA